MGKLIIIRGNSGSGKTSLAKLLQKKLGPNTLRVSHDMIRMELLNVRGREGVLRSEPLMIELLRYGKANSEVTILEGILPTRDYSRLFEAALDIFGADIYAYYYDLTFDETLRRHMTKPNREVSVRLICAGGGLRGIISRPFRLVVSSTSGYSARSCLSMTRSS